MRPDVPDQMKAIAIDRFGGPEVLHPGTLPVPSPGAHEVLLRLDTAGIGVWDPWVREGGLAEGETRFPYVIGNDGAGEVVAVGPDVHRLRVGDRAYAYQMQGGFYAEYVTVKEDLAAPIPSTLDPKEAGALGADGITALCGLDDQLHMQPGQSVMIIGASGGIGHLAVQLAKRMGARVLAVASGADGVKLVASLGADVAVDGRSQDISEAARRFVPDAALVLAGGPGVNEALPFVRADGRIAYPNGVEPVPQAPKGVELLAYDGIPSAEAFDRLNRLIGAAPFHVELDKTYNLEEAVQAHREIQQHHLGKRALRIH